MHRLAAMPGGWNPNAEGVIFLDQTPAPILILTAADTEIQTLAQAIARLPADFPAVRVANLLNLQQQLSIDTYAETVLSQAEVIILRLLGGEAYWSYGLEVVKTLSAETGASLVVLPGDDRPDPHLISHSTVSLTIANTLWRYLSEGGRENVAHGLQFVADTCLGTLYHPPQPHPIPRVGLYDVGSLAPAPEAIVDAPAPLSSVHPKVGILFYRAHYLAGNTEPIEVLCQALQRRQLHPVPLFVSSLRDVEVQAKILDAFQPKADAGIEVLLNATSFAIARLDTDDPTVALWQTLDVPVLQVILSGGTVEQWQQQWQGLSPRDTAMNIALPEVDGRIITRAISFKTVETRHPQLETDVVRYASKSDRIEFVADLAASWVKLRRTPVEQRRIALILANYPTRDGRLANGVGLDTPASCIHILTALQAAGYTLNAIPQDVDNLIQQLTTGVTNDPEGQDFREIRQYVSWSDYRDYFATLPADVQQQMGDRWGLDTLNPPERSNSESPEIAVSGLQLGHIFVGIQPARGYDRDPTLNYHAPDLEPTHEYLAFYYWIRQQFQADAIVHVGKHGNLEWLPGKSLALSSSCYPEIALGAMPHFYPFIVNDPGEGSQAKRRAQAVIIDHLTPPLTRAELHGNLHQLENLVDEYYEAQSLDPSRLEIISDRIRQMMLQENLHRDLNLSEDLNRSDMAAIDTFVTRADRYLCELKEAQIRDGLHIFGICPQGRQLRDLIIAIARHPAPGRQGLTQAIADDLELDLDPLTTDWTDPSPDPRWRTVGQVVEFLEQTAADCIDHLLSNANSSDEPAGIHSQKVLDWIGDRLLPNLTQTSQEMTHLLHGLAGRYVPSGASGAPTRGRADVLPTGRNFFSVDIRAIPTESAWAVGRKAAEALIERYTQEHGNYPKTLALSIWGTSTMRTGGDDIAEALTLLGVQPVWDGVARRVVDFEIIPVSALGRPRVDVTLRISGFFRDAFPNLIDLFQQAVDAVSSLAEPEHDNPLAAQVQHDQLLWQEQGLSNDQAVERSRYRVFGSKPGAYGAGLQGLIEAQNWTDDADLARAYLAWSGYAYTGQGQGHSAMEAFEHRLKHLQIVLHNQDNREHDLLDSDDYYQFQGGLTAAVRSLTGQNPTLYFGDHAIPSNPKIRHLREELARVYRSRVINPKWIAGVMRHGYKGAFELSATVDYLFAYDATTHCVEDFMYEGIAQAYLLDPGVQDFVQEKNPWALRDMAERLLEAHQRGLWQSAPRALLDQLRSIALEAEAQIENVPFTPI